MTAPDGTKQPLARGQTPLHHAPPRHPESRTGQPFVRRRPGSERLLPLQASAPVCPRHPTAAGGRRGALTLLQPCQAPPSRQAWRAGAAAAVCASALRGFTVQREDRRETTTQTDRQTRLGQGPRASAGPRQSLPGRKEPVSTAGQYGRSSSGARIPRSLGTTTARARLSRGGVGGGGTPRRFPRTRARSFPARCTKGLKSFSLKFKFQQALAVL